MKESGTIIVQGRGKVQLVSRRLVAFMLYQVVDSASREPDGWSEGLNCVLCKLPLSLHIPNEHTLGSDCGMKFLPDLC